VYGIIKQSGGYIWVYSESGKGTSFKIYLPRVSATGETIDVQQHESAAVEVGHETILVVEDELNLRRLARQYLEKQGYTVLEAADGSAAITISSSYPGPIHLLLTDVIMPGMNGKELAQRLTSLRPETRVLYMSGYTENVIGHNGTLDNGVTLLPKPFTLPALRSKVREVLNAPSPMEVAMSVQAANQTARNKPKLSPFRAQRFQLHLPLKYRQLGQNNWRSGTTENISRSGLLFHAEEALAPNALLEINLVLPPEIAGLSAAEVVCRGEVVRAADEVNQGMGPALAAKILQYHFQHGQISQA
jgi:DNA-binding response OmpR family regulator